MSISKADITDAMRLAMHRAPALRQPGAPAATAKAVGVSGAAKATQPVAESVAPAQAKRKSPGLSKPRGRKGMNKTEAAMALRLEAQKRSGDIRRYEREGVSLRWPDGMVYNPDFVVWQSWASIIMIETKGAFVRDDALVKFRAARAHWPEFQFQMWRLTKGRWEQVL